MGRTSFNKHGLPCSQCGVDCRIKSSSSPDLYNLVLYAGCLAEARFETSPVPHQGLVSQSTSQTSIGIVVLPSRTCTSSQAEVMVAWQQDTGGSVGLSGQMAHLGKLKLQIEVSTSGSLVHAQVNWVGPVHRLGN